MKPGKNKSWFGKLARAYIRCYDSTVDGIVFSGLVGLSENELRRKVANFALDRPGRVLAELIEDELLARFSVGVLEKVEIYLVDGAWLFV